MKKLTVVAYWGLLAALVATGCSSAGKLTQSNQEGSKIPIILPENGGVAFSIKWPERSRLIPLASEAIQIRSMKDGVEVANTVIARPTSGNTSSVRIDLPPGVINCIVTAHPDNGAVQTPQASGSIEVTIRSRETTAASLTLGSTIQNISFDLPPEFIRPGQQVQVNAQAKDSSGAFVITSEAKWQWTSSNNAIVSITNNGSRAELTPGSARGLATIIAEETESGKKAQFTVNNLMATGEDDYALFAKIERVKSLSSQVVIDGVDIDWSGVPEYSDPVGDHGNSTGLDILKTSVMPTEDSYIVRFKTDVSISNNLSKLYEIMFDIMADNWNPELVLGFIPGRTDGTFWVIEPGQTPVPHPTSGFSISSSGGVTEIKLPYSVVKSYLPASMQDHIPSTSNRPHIRVWIRTFEKSGSEWVVRDTGDCAASYVLKPTPYDLGDAALPRPATAKRSIIRSPLEGVCIVGQGAFGSVSHQSVWAYDISQMNRQFLSSLSPRSTNNADYIIWEKPLFSGSSGSIIHSYDSAIDLPGGGPPDNSATPNSVAYQIPGGVDVWYFHLRQNSSLVTVGQSIADRQTLGKVGNSGPSYGPHLHLQSQESGSGTLPNKSVTTAIRNVRLLIAPLVEDPWGRDLPIWDIREGYMFCNRP